MTILFYNGRYSLTMEIEYPLTIAKVSTVRLMKLVQEIVASIIASDFDAVLYLSAEVLPHDASVACNVQFVKQREWDVKSTKDEYISHLIDQFTSCLRTEDIHIATDSIRLNVVRIG